MVEGMTYFLPSREMGCEWCNAKIRLSGGKSLPYTKSATINVSLGFRRAYLKIPVPLSMEILAS
jgi:hypothetical protein